MPFVVYTIAGQGAGIFARNGDSSKDRFPGFKLKDHTMNFAEFTMEAWFRVNDAHAFDSGLGDTEMMIIDDDDDFYVQMEYRPSNAANRRWKLFWKRDSMSGEADISDDAKGL